jgi:hypothetical protein
MKHYSGFVSFHVPLIAASYAESSTAEEVPYHSTDFCGVTEETKISFFL